MGLTRREKAAQQALNDIRWLIQGNEAEDVDSEETYLDGPTIIGLLDKNFHRLDPSDEGISREQLMIALMNPQAFTADEYEMLRLLTKYFDTIINLSEDEVGGETKISRDDMQVLEQFLVHSKMTLKELHSWCSLSQNSNTADLGDVGPPPMSGA